MTKIAVITGAVKAAASRTESEPGPIDVWANEALR